VITRQKAAVVSDFQRSGPLNLTQGHRNWHGSICRHVVGLWLPINSISVVTLGLSSIVPRYWPKIANSSEATSILGPRSRVPFETMKFDWELLPIIHSGPRSGGNLRILKRRLGLVNKNVRDTKPKSLMISLAISIHTGIGTDTELRLVPSYATLTIWWTMATAAAIKLS